jgi:L-2-hydroxycarboxylate dehydrogenase (NAD+)
MAGTVVHHLSLRDFCARVLEKLGAPADEAGIVANSLVLADLRGVDTHGVRRLPSYAELLRAGVVRAGSRLSVLREFPGGFSVDGGHGFGQVVARRAMQMAIGRAKDTGVACVGVRNGGHIGAHGNTAILAAEEGMLGFLVTNGRPVLAPPGGVRSAVSSTPFAIGCPSGREFPLVLDMALSVVARGRILRAIAEGTEIPATWAIDAAGRPSIRARRAAAQRCRSAATRATAWR